MNMQTVISQDGTPIAFDREGSGPALILVTGAIARRADAASLAGKLAPHFTVYSYDRRGRGDSGDTPPYAVEREVADIGALIDKAGGSAFVFGHSSGAVLAMEATASFPGIRKLAVYEPPFIVDDSRPPVTNDIVEQLAGLLSANRRSDMLELWMTGVVGIPAEFVTQMRQQPSWTGMEPTAHTLLYDLAIMKDSETGQPLPPQLAARLASITVPTLVMAGGASPNWARSGAQAAAQAIPGAQYRVLEGQTHGVADEVLIPLLVEFFNA
jgi:pimeloyl-ACP methyl ester carboxylesterase